MHANEASPHLFWLFCGATEEQYCAEAHPARARSEWRYLTANKGLIKTTFPLLAFNEGEAQVFNAFPPDPLSISEAAMGMDLTRRLSPNRGKNYGLEFSLRAPPPIKGQFRSNSP